MEDIIKIVDNNEKISYEQSFLFSLECSRLLVSKR